METRVTQKMLQMAEMKYCLEEQRYIINGGQLAPERRETEHALVISLNLPLSGALAKPGGGS